MSANRFERASRTSEIVRNFETLKQQIEINNQIRSQRNSNMQQQLDPKVLCFNIENDAGNRTPLANCQTEFNQVDEKSNTNFLNNKKSLYQSKNKDNLNNEQLKSKIVNNIEVFDDHKIPLDLLKEKYHTDFEKGLLNSYANEQNKILGDNLITPKKKSSLFVKFLHEITNPFSCLLWFASLLSFITYGLDQTDPSNLYLGIILIFLILISGGLSFQQNLSSEALMESFKNFLPSNCTVIRDDKLQSILAAKLVPGDIIRVKAGEKIPADIRILQSSEMKVDNSPLTGESEPLLRTNVCSHPDNPLETANLAFFGTLCKEGHGKGVVVRIGDSTTLGQIANLTSQEKKRQSSLRTQLNHLALFIVVLSLTLGFLFFFLGWKVVGYPILPCLLFGVGIIVANVPEGLMGEVTICLAVTAKALASKNVLVKNLEAVETLGSASCICSDKTGTLTQNIMTVENIWYNNKTIKAVNKSLASPINKVLYDEQNPTFQALHKAAILSSDAKFDLQKENDVNNIDYKKCPAMGDATETGIIRFYQYIEDIEQTRRKTQLAKQIDGQDARMAFNSNNKYALVIAEEQTQESEYCIYIKGAPEKIWSFCSKIVVEGKDQKVDQEWDKQFNSVNLYFSKQGQRVLGFAKLHLPKDSYPFRKSQFTVSSVEKFNFKMSEFSFIGLISFIDPPKPKVPAAILECRSAGIKVIMVTGDQPPTAAAIARQVNIIPKSVKTNIEIMEDENTDWDTAAEKCKAIVIHGDQIVKSLNRELIEGIPEFTQLRSWVKKPYCVFARTTPAQKLQIVKACQAEGYICAVTGDGVNDSPAIKQADIGISMNISGSDVTKDSADMILLDDDFASIVAGIEEGRKIFDNLKKAIVYVLTTNIPEIFPFLIFIIFQIPLPISNIFMIVLNVGTDVIPAIALGYEQAEIDIMTRTPRKKTDHLISLKIIIHGYLLMGPMSNASGMNGFFTTMNQLGFPVMSLFGMAKLNGIHRPPLGDFQSGIDPIKCKNIENNDCAYFNQKIMNPQNDSCVQDMEQIQKNQLDKWFIDWLSNKDEGYDLRKGFIECDQKSGKWRSTTNFKECSLENNISPVSGHTACYTTEALKYGQSAFIAAIIFFQVSNVFACKSRQNPYYLTPPNKLIFIGILSELSILIFLLYCPGVQSIFGTRPLSWWQFGIPSVPFSMTILIWQEVRKYLIRNNVWFQKYCFW